jgi:fatty-acid desaturase
LARSSPVEQRQARDLLPVPNRPAERRLNFRAVLGVLAFGDGWHANQHADPRSARHDLTWWEIDVTYWVLALFATMGFVSALQGPRRG